MSFKDIKTKITMLSKKARVVIIGAGMAGLTAATTLHTATDSAHLFDLLVVEGGATTGGRINSTEFCGDRVELGATWIHGIEGSPVYKIAQEKQLLSSHHQPWESMDGMPDNPVFIAEGGHELAPCLVDPISTTFKNILSFIKGKEVVEDDGVTSEIVKHCISKCSDKGLSVGSFLREGLEAYWRIMKDGDGNEGIGSWSKKSLEEAIFTMHENIHRNYTSADDLAELDFKAERDFKILPGEEITIARGYSSVIESLASGLPVGMIQLGRRVDKIHWQSEACQEPHLENSDDGNRPVKLYFSDGTTLSADHVIVTVSLGVLKRGIVRGCEMFDPPLPDVKNRAISRLGYGLVDKVFLHLLPHEREEIEVPYIGMVFHQPNSEFKHPMIPQWIRRTSLLYPIYKNSRVLLAWFTGQDALELEALSDEEISNGFSITASDFLSSKSNFEHTMFGKVLRTQWGTNPLFLGSYSYVAVGSSEDDVDILAEPLPQNSNLYSSSQQLQILFAEEATHRTHYSTTHGAYFSGLREANRLLEHYKL